MHYKAEQLWTPLSESIQGWDDAFHELMLNDRLRMAAYRQAIFEVVRPGDVVVDLGTGTGILSQWALEAGAAKVTGIEMNADILGLAIERLERAGHGQGFVPICQLSYDVELEQPADVLISEIIGNMADNENFQPILQDAIRRFLKPRSRVLPASVSSYLTPVAALSAHHDLCAGRIASLAPRYAVDELNRKRGKRSRFDLYYDCIVPRELYLSDPQLVCRYDGAWDQPSTYRRELAYAVKSNGTLTGFKAYFVAQLSANTVLDISGDDIAAGNTSDSWKHAYLPIQSPIEVRRGDVLAMTFSRSSQTECGTGFQQAYEWQGDVKRDGVVIGEFCQGTADRRSLEQAGVS